MARDAVRLPGDDIGLLGCLATALMMGYVLWCIVHYGLR
jgi:hypothetical protein